MLPMGATKDQLIELLVTFYPENERANWAHWYASGWTKDALRRQIEKVRGARLAFCTYGTCANPQHDHTTTVDDDGNDLDGRVPVPMLCTHCRQPAHYSYADERYHHDNPDAPPCFMIH